MPWLRYRTVRLEPEAESALESARPIWARLDHAWQAMEWLLARQGPKLGFHREVSDVHFQLYKQAGDDLADTPDILAVFTCDDDLVVVYRLLVTNRQEPQYELVPVD